MDAKLPEILWAADNALLVRAGRDSSIETERRVQGLLRSLRQEGIEGLRDLHPAYRSVLVTCDPMKTHPARFEAQVRQAAARAVLAEAPPDERLVEIPVCYAPRFAPDLEDVARSAGLAREDVVRLHAAAEYRVCFLGFVAGFPYLRGLPERLATERLPVPRKKVPAGSVAIAGLQAGVYPFSTPGGWRIVGRTPLALFRAEREPPSLLAPGDRVRFVAIDEDELLSLAGPG